MNTTSVTVVGRFPDAPVTRAVLGLSSQPRLLFGPHIDGGVFRVVLR